MQNSNYLVNIAKAIIKINQDNMAQQNFITRLNLSTADQSDLQEVLQGFNSAIQLNPDDYDAYIQLALSLYHQCHPDSAIKSL